MSGACVGINGAYQSRLGISNMPENDSSTMPSKADGCKIKGDDRRSHERHISIFRLAKIRSNDVEGLAYIKNVSSNGMLLEIHEDFHLGETITVFPTEDHKLEGSVRWRKDGSVGIQFFSGINVPDLLSGNSLKQKGKLPRLPRVRMQQEIKMLVGSKLIKAEICDISPAGICIKANYVVEVGRKLTVSVPNLDDLSGIVRWQSDGRIGMAFAERIAVPQLMNWLTNYYRSVSSPKKALKAELAPAYKLVGYDEAGQTTSLCRVKTAGQALLTVKAKAGNYFSVRVFDAEGRECFPNELAQRAFTERNGVDIEISRH